MGRRSLYRLLVIYEETSPNRKSYAVDLDGHLIGDIGDENILNYSTAPGWHTVGFSSTWGKDKTERFYIADDQYVTRVFVHLNARNALEVRIDSGTSAMVNLALNGPTQDPEEEPRYIPATTAATPARRSNTAWWIVGLFAAFALGVLAMFLFYNVIRPDLNRSSGTYALSQTTAQVTAPQQPVTAPTPVPTAATEAATPAESETRTETVSTENAASGSLGDFYVAISGAALTQDDNGMPAIVITYSWTNNSA